MFSTNDNTYKYDFKEYAPKKNQVIVFDSSICVASEYVSRHGEAIHYIGTEIVVN